jgi:hypothetical protein
MKRVVISLIFSFALSLVFGSNVFAQYTSPSYKAEETFFGAGGELDASSSQYKAQSSVGALGVDFPSGSSYKAYSGFLTPNEPFLTMAINTSTVNLGTLDSTAAKTGTATFTVRAYTDRGYTVVTASQPPKTSTGLSLNPMSSQGPSAVGTEQFGINLMANTSPATFGANPSLQPDSTFADGKAAPGYDTANNYKYNAGDVIAQTNNSGWGQTTYTISYIANISSITSAGSYSMDHDIVAIATY